MYLSHLRKTEIRNFSSVLRILWDEFRNYLFVLATTIYLVLFPLVVCQATSSILHPLLELLFIQVCDHIAALLITFYGVGEA